MNSFQKFFKSIFPQKQNYKILSLDGGGIRGLYAAKLLTLIEEEFKVKLAEHFDIIAGTSVGAIIGASIASGRPMKEFYEIINTNAEKIFTKRPFSLSIKPTLYENEGLIEILDILFENKTLSNVKPSILITATNIENEKQKVYISNKASGDLLLKDIVLASCSAPMYFPPHEVSKELLVDGGLWANDPVILAIYESIFQKINRKSTYCLSVGTGIFHIFGNSSTTSANIWGTIKSYIRTVEQMLVVLSDSSHSMAEYYLLEKNYLRLNFSTNKYIFLDNTSNDSIKFLENEAIKSFEKNKEKIMTLIGK